jgi:energy-coupling factor transporter ATP-binding protein EcfA2
VEVVLIVGADNSGKSTLVRSLTGLGRGSHDHASPRNVAKLHWIDVNRPMETFCLISSLNEGKLGQRGTVSPRDVAALIDQYETSASSPCERAILCVSSSVQNFGWTVHDYFKVGFGSHTLRNVIVLGAATVQFSNPIVLPGAPHERNRVAASARQAIDLL